MNTNSFPLHRLLKKHWGFDSFRPLQEEIITSVLKRQDTLALLPTGGGKSLCFQLPALCMEGITLVISPLIALMNDQVAQLKDKGIAALAIHSGMPFKAVERTLNNALYGPYKLLYLSPERLQSPLFLDFLRALPVSLITVDEAHCISSWGYDFRPAYLEIGQLREGLPEVPVLAMTATATQSVRQDIIEKLQLRKPNLQIKSFRRDNLSYSVFFPPDKQHKLEEILATVPGSSIVFCRSRKQTETVARQLRNAGLSADHYHAGMTGALRDRRQQEWISGSLRIMVSTSAFGMGIDKPDVRTVIHYGMPDSPEAYYQQAGRAGRDGKKAYAVLLCSAEEAEQLRAQSRQQFPTLAEVRKIYRGLVSFLNLPAGAGEGLYFDFDLRTFCARFGHRPAEVRTVLRLLEQESLLALVERVRLPDRIRFSLPKSRLNAFEQDQPRWAPMIHCLLRSYEGIFRDFTAVYPEQVARLLQWPIKQVIRQWQQLQQLGVLAYQPKKDGPQIYFASERIAVDRLQINTRLLAARRAAHEKRLEAMINYVQRHTICRSQLLLQYFDETDSPPCGICDVCLQQLSRSKR